MLVTGGASGFGRATVEHFKKLGSKIIFCDLTTSNGAAIAKELGESVTFVPANVTKEIDVENVMNEIERLHGRLNVVVNCAGIAYGQIMYNFKKDRPRDLHHFDPVLKVSRATKVCNFCSIMIQLDNVCFRQMF